MIISNSTEASNDAPAVPEVGTSWNPPSDDDMANDTDACQALIDDDEDIMQVEYIPAIFHRATSFHQRSPTPAAGSKPVLVEGRPLLRWNFDVRLVGPPIPIPIHQLSIGPERSMMMSARDFMDLPAAKQHQKTLLGQLFIKERPPAYQQ